jgi:membrane-associated protease RseP (regulator of RpoE activity)
MFRHNKSLFLLIALGAAFLIPAVAGAQPAKDQGEVGSGAKAPVTEPYLGVGAVPLHPALTAQLPEVIGKGRGVMVANVMKGSPAEHTGLKVHDILISYDKQDVYSPEQLVKLVRNDKPGRDVTIGYVRGGKTQEASVRLAEAPLPERKYGRTAFRLPLDGLLPMATNRHSQELADSERTPWTTFEALTIKKLKDGRYQTEIEFRNADKKVIHRDYQGTREEIRDAIREDKELPADEREHLLRSLDESQPSVLQVMPEVFRGFKSNRDFFDWPDLLDF